jgi:hypothetical protein
MTKPNNPFAWATTPGSTVEPSPSEKASGFGYGDKVPAPWINWLWNGAHQWFQYLSNLHAENEFLNKAYAWTAAHAFDGDITLTGPANEIAYTTPRDTNRYLHPAAATSDGATWVYAMGVWTSVTPGLLLTFVLPLPDESIFHSANICVKNGGTVDLVATFKVYEATPADNQPYNLLPTQLGDTSTPTIEPGGTATLGIIDMSVPVDATHKVYFMTLSVTQPDAAVFWGHVQYGATRATAG